MEPMISVSAAIRSGVAGRWRGGRTQTKRRQPDSRQSCFEPCLCRSEEKCAGGFFFSDALDMELALRQSTGGGVSVCLDPAHLPGPWTCNMRGLMYCSICSLPSRDCQQIGHLRCYGWIVDRSSSMLSPREVAVRWHVRAFRVRVGVGLCNRWKIESASRWSTTIKNSTCRFGHGKNGPIRYLEQ
jgi:hypothetical protein